MSLWHPYPLMSQGVLSPIRGNRRRAWRRQGMTTFPPRDRWMHGDAYEAYVGRWSRVVARVFLEWLAVPTDARWLDVGCGTGALTSVILKHAEPRQVVGIDPSDGFVECARSQIEDLRVRFEIGDAQALPMSAETVDVTVAGLSLNFVPDPRLAMAEMARVTRRGGIVGAYVWDYAEGMEMMRRFWDAAGTLDPAVHVFTESTRFAALCHPDALSAQFVEVGLSEVQVRAIEIATPFRNFDDYWQPFLGGQGSAPSYVVSLDEAHRAALREAVRAALPIDTDGMIRLRARAWAVQGRSPG